MVCKRMDSMNCLALLRYCYFYRQRIWTAAISNKVAQLTQLKDLFIGASRLCDMKESSTDVFLKCTTLTQLQSLSIYMKDIFTEDMEDFFASQCNLMSLICTLMKSRSGEWSAFRHLTKLEYLCIYYSEELPNLVHLTNIKRLELTKNHIQDLDEFYKMTNLTNLTYLKMDEDLPENHQLIEIIARMTTIQELEIGQSHVNYHFTVAAVSLITETMTNLTRLSWITVTCKNNDDVGWIPETISNLQRLRSLDLMYWGESDPMDEEETQKILSLSNLTHLGLTLANKQALDSILTLTGLQSLIVWGPSDDVNNYDYITSILPNVRVTDSIDKLYYY